MWSHSQLSGLLVIGQELLDAAGLTYDVDYTRCAYVHDEVQLSVIPAEVDRVKSTTCRQQLLKLVATTTSVYLLLLPQTTVTTGLVHTDTILIMEDDVYFNFQVDQDALRLLLKCVDRYLEKWPGGKPTEQDALRTMLVELKKAAF